jgi:L-serine dehydratase
MMKEISVFDVIGPNMIGPSSSHTAGALKIALLAGKLANAAITEVHFVLYGSFAKTYKGHGTDRALVGGILGFNTEDPRIKDSFLYAEQAGLQYSFELNETNKDVHPNTVDITITSEDGGTVCVRGVSTGGGNCRIERIDGISVDLTGDYTTLLIRQRDTFGVIAYITSCLSEYKVNIAFMSLYRESKGEAAYTVIETDNGIPPELLSKIKQCKEIASAMVIKI